MSRLLRMRALTAAKSALLTGALATMLLAAADPVDEARRAPQSVRTRARELARWAVEREIAGKPLSPLPFSPAGMLARPAPCFVTISYKDRRHGCTGSFEPQTSTLAGGITQTAVRAWKLDPRSRRLTSFQIRQSRFYVTIPGPRKPVRDPSVYPPANYGLLVRSSGRTAVLLPGEAKTSRWQVSEAKRQAGVPPDAAVTFEVFPAVTFADTAR